MWVSVCQFWNVYNSLTRCTTLPCLCFTVVSIDSVVTVPTRLDFQSLKCWFCQNAGLCLTLQGCWSKADVPTVRCEGFFLGFATYCLSNLRAKIVFLFIFLDFPGKHAGVNRYFGCNWSSLLLVLGEFPKPQSINVAIKPHQQLSNHRNWFLKGAVPSGNDPTQFSWEHSQASPVKHLKTVSFVISGFRWNP